jgi:MFS family permease
MFPVPRLDLAKYRSEKEFVFLAGAIILGLFAIFFPSFYLRLLGLSLHVSSAISFNTIVIFSFTGVLGRILFGFASDIAGIWNAFLAVSGVTAIMIISMVGVSGAKGIIAYSVFWGFFAGGWFSLMITILASMASRISEVGTRIGLVLTLASPIFLLAPLLYNMILTHSLNWIIPCAVFAAFFVAVTGLVFFARVFMIKAHRSEIRRKLWNRWNMIPGVLIV